MTCKACCMAVARSPVRKNLVTTFRASPKTCRLTPISMLQTRSLPCNQGRDRDGNGTRPPTTFGCPIPTTGSEAAGGSGVFEQAAQNRGTRTNETGLHCQSRLHSPPTGGLNCQKVAGCGDARPYLASKVAAATPTTSRSHQFQCGGAAGATVAAGVAIAGVTLRSATTPLQTKT